MPSDARRAAMAAAYEADAPLREQEQRQERRREQYALRIARESAAMTAAARQELLALLDIDASGWEVVTEDPTYAVLRDPTDDAYHKLTLTVIWVNPAKLPRELEVRYTPYEYYGKDYTHNRQGDGLNWHCGPVVTDLLSLGRAIQAEREEDVRIHRSMPDHLP